MSLTTAQLASLLNPWSDGSGPLYRKLADALQRSLERGHLETGTKLPPERALANALAVSRNTVTAAYNELKTAGWIDAQRGSATTVTAARYSAAGSHRTNGIFATLLRGHPDAIDLTIAVPDAAPIVRRVSSDPASHIEDLSTLTQGHGYHPRGLPSLRSALARIITANGLETSEEQILVTTGAQQAITLVVQSLTRPGDLVAVEEVSFPGALDAIADAGARPLPIRVGPDGLDIESLREVLAQSPRLVYLIPSFHNPSGALLDEIGRKRVARMIGETDTTLIDDMTLAELDFGTPTPPPLAALEPDAPIITVGSLSKVFWGGLRIGWVRASKTLISHLAESKATADLGTSAMTQAMATAMLEKYNETRAWRNEELARSLRACTNALSDLLPEWEWQQPLGGPHLWIKLPDTDAMAFSQRMLRNGVAVVAGPLLAVNEHTATDYIRIPYYKQPTELEDAVQRLAETWNSRGKSHTKNGS